MTDNTQELDEILSDLRHMCAGMAHSGYSKDIDSQKYVDIAEQAILDWHNKQIVEVQKEWNAAITAEREEAEVRVREAVEAVLDRLESGLIRSSTIDVRASWVKLAIEAERNKLKAEL